MVYLFYNKKEKNRILSACFVDFQIQKMNKIKTKRKIHILNEVDFEINPSSIEGIGLGLFARQTIHKGDHIGDYTGKILTDKIANSDKYCHSKYLLWVCKDHWIWGEGRLSNYTRYVNHSDEPNAEIVTTVRWKKARFRAIKRILAGEEVFINYGDEYWEE